MSPIDSPQNARPRLRRSNRDILLATALLTLAGIVVLGFGWRWASSSAESIRERGERRGAASLRGEAAAARDRLGQWLRSTRERRAADSADVDLQVVALTRPQPTPPTDALRDAERLEFVDDDPARAAASYERILESIDLDDGVRITALRNLARLRFASGDVDLAIDALRRAVELDEAPDRERLLAEFELARRGAGDAEDLAERIEGGEFPSVPPGERVHVHTSVGGDPNHIRALRALAKILESDDPERVVGCDDGLLAWRVARTDRSVDLALVERAAFYRRVLPAVDSEELAVGRTAAVPDEAIELLVPFPEGESLRVGPSARAAIDREARAARSSRLALAAAAAGLLIAAGGLLGWVALRQRRFERRKLDFMTAVTHELKTPLANILLSAETIGRHGADDPSRVPEFAAVIAEEATRLRRKIQDVLDVASGLRSLDDDRAEFDVAEVLREVVDEYGRSADGSVHPIELRVAAGASGEAIRVRGSRELFAQAVSGLVDNAMKFGKGSDVRVTVERESSALTILVDDGGPGVAPADRERIFEPFVRAVRDVEGHVSGTGLGLAIVRQCAEGFGGTVRLAESSLGGAAFRIEIPQDRIEASEA